MFKLKEQNYLSLMMVLAPICNFISGIAIDLYSPSMPAIALYFNTSEQAVQNTIAVFVLGWSVGCLFWGVLLDLYGRKKIIIVSLSIFVISSFAALYCHNIFQLMLVRFIQGTTTAALSVGSRTLVADLFSGHAFEKAIQNVSIVYGLGTIIGPFIGGYLQHHFGWQANFYAFFISGIIILMLVKIFVQEKFKKPTYQLPEMIKFYKTLLFHKKFMTGCMIIGIAQIELTIYPTVGPFLVESLSYSSIVYGKTALIIGSAYVAGATCNRFLLKFVSQKNLLNLSFVIALIFLLVQILFILDKQFNLVALVFPLVIMCFGNGFVFGNIISNCIKLFKNNAGMTTALQITMLMAINAIGIFLISLCGVSSLTALFFILLLTSTVKFLLYCFEFKKIFTPDVPLTSENNA